MDYVGNLFKSSWDFVGSGAIDIRRDFERI